MLPAPPLGCGQDVSWDDPDEGGGWGEQDQPRALARAGDPQTSDRTRRKTPFRS